MSIAQRDYILRLIEQFAAALARIVAKREQNDLAGALSSTHETAGQLFGPIAGSLDELASQGVGLLIQDAGKLAIYAALTAERAAIAEAGGRGARAARLRARAMELYLEAAARAPGSAQILGPIEALRTEVDEQLLDARYRAELRRLGSCPS